MLFLFTDFSQRFIIIICQLKLSYLGLNILIKINRINQQTRMEQQIQISSIQISYLFQEFKYNKTFTYTIYIFQGPPQKDILFEFSVISVFLQIPVDYQQAYICNRIHTIGCLTLVFYQLSCAKIFDNVKIHFIPIQKCYQCKSTVKTQSPPKVNLFQCNLTKKYLNIKKSIIKMQYYQLLQTPSRIQPFTSIVLHILLSQKNQALLKQNIQKKPDVFNNDNML
eukprot:TRINITY_DN17440_c2_g1_i1.p2 TRINITY_DN17440_c2_g1~~TRINITY_DN17440_c2_g1_i1.p2  ORF type:complete len:224 (-),score=-23.38 TRINITY_DN17440_c2_g1_i1:47-718(-)